MITESIVLGKGEIGRIALRENIAALCFQSDWEGNSSPVSETLTTHIYPSEFHITGKGSNTFEALEDYYQTHKKMLKEFSRTLPADYQIVEMIRKPVQMVPCFPKVETLELAQTLEAYLKRKPTQEELNTKYFVCSVQAWAALPDTVEAIQEEEPSRTNLSKKSNEELIAYMKNDTEKVKGLIGKKEEIDRMEDIMAAKKEQASQTV